MTGCEFIVMLLSGVFQFFDIDKWLVFHGGM
jgi:hypothetical protein